MDPRKFLLPSHPAESEKKEYSFALSIGPELVKGVLWTVQKGEVQISSHFHERHWSNPDELVRGADEILTATIEELDLGQEEEPTRVIFGLPFNWVEGDKILPQNLSILRKLCQDLSLKPAGFVVITEAIVKYLKTLEGLPPNVILVNVSPKEIDLSLIRAGQVSGQTLVKRSVDLAADVAEGLARVKTAEVLPARIILCDAGRLTEEEKEAILDYPWLEKEKEFNFLHLPKTEVVEEEFNILAVAFSGGVEISGALGIKLEGSASRPALAAADEPPADLPPEEKAPLNQPSLSFPPETKSLPIIDLPEETASPSPLGFGFKESPVISPAVKPSFSPSPVLAEELNFSGKETDTLPPVKPKRPLFFSVGGLFKKMKPPALSAPRPHLSFSWRIGLILAVIFLLAGSAGGFWFLPRAKVILYVQPQSLEKELAITLDQKASGVNLENMIVPAQTVSAELETTGGQAATGTKLIGEKATGEVVIYNRTGEQKNLAVGTFLTGPGNLRFSLSEAVIVASESAGSDYSRVPGKATAKVVALNIGGDSNLATGTEFEVGKYSQTEVVGRNESAFSGGSSREVRVVSRQDQEKLLASLTEELRLQAEEKLRTKLSSSQKLISDSLTEAIVEKAFDHSVDDEVDSLQLTLKAKFEALVYQESQLNDLIHQKIADSVPAGFELKEEKNQIEFELDKVTDSGQALFKASFKTALWPQINLSQIRSSLRGKKIEIGQFYLNQLPNLSGFEVLFSPEFVRQFKTFPWRENNIQVEIASE